MENGKTLGTTSVVLMIVLSVITCGIYYYIWFFLRKKDLEQLQTLTKLTDQMPSVMVALAVVGFLLNIIAGGADPEARGLLVSCGAICNLAVWILLLVLSFRVRRILDEYYNQRLKMGVPISAVLTFFFTVLYLQYKMNRLPAPAPSDADIQLDVTPIGPF